MEFRTFDEVFGPETWRLDYDEHAAYWTATFDGGSGPIVQFVAPSRGRAVGAVESGAVTDAAVAGAWHAFASVLTGCGFGRDTSVRYTLTIQ